MSNADVLQKAVEMAGKNGYPRPDDAPLSSWKRSINSGQAYRIIFSHDFAKAFWGEKRYEHVGCGGVLDVLKEIKCPKCGHVEPPLKGYDGWQFHLQQMVISDDPLKYLEKFLDKK
jgi:hypothetical protein